MKLVQLQAFNEVMNTGTVTEASRRLKCSQPRVSRLIGELEEDIDFPLFIREKQRLVPTIEGQLFYQEIERILLGLEDIERIVKDIRHNRETSLRILCQSHFAQGVIHHAIRAFEKKAPGIRYYLEIRPRKQLAQWLGGHQFDLAFSPLPAKHPLIRHEPLISVKLLVAMPKSHPLSKNKQITIEEFNEGPVIALTKGMLMRRRLDSLCQEAGLQPNIRIETPSVFSACQLVGQGLGITLTDPFVANVIMTEDFVVKPFSPDYPISYGILYHRQNPPRHLVRRFVEVTRRVVQEIGQQQAALCD